MSGSNGKAGGKAGRANIVIRKEEVVEGGHHGGAWKVAYADFVTAMMAFFLLMWLLNATTEAQRKGLADYFAPNNEMSRGSSGTGKPFGGKSAFSDGALLSDRGVADVRPGVNQPIPEIDDPDPDAPPTQQVKSAAGSAEVPTEQQGQKSAGGGIAELASTTPSNEKFRANAMAASAAAMARAEADKRERAAFEQAAEQIREAVRADPRLAELGRQLSIDQTPEGLRIQILDEEKLPMFATGSATLNDRARMLLQKVAPVLSKLPEAIALSGHTDAAPFKGDGRSNWELSSERANATRRLLVESGLAETRFRSVTGNADRDPLLPADPLAAANRRIAIVVLRAIKPGA